MALPSTIPGSQLAGGVKMLGDNPVDFWAGPYDSAADACAVVKVANRPYRTVIVAGVEMWWLPGDLSNNGLKEKTAGGLTPEQQQALGLLKPVFGFDYDNVAHGYNTLVEAVGQGLQAIYYRTEQTLDADTLFDEGIIIGSGAGINVYADVTVRLFTDTESVSLYGSDAFCQLNGDHFRLILGVPALIPAGQSCALSYCWFREVLTVAGTAYLRPGTITQGDIIADLPQRPDGGYTTPQGGVIYDQRGAGGPGGPAPDLSDYYTKAQSDARYPELDGSGKVPASQLPTTVADMSVIFRAAGAQAADLDIDTERLVGTVSQRFATAALLNISYKKNGVLTSLPVAVVLGDKITVSATADAAGGVIVLNVS